MDIKKDEFIAETIELARKNIENVRYKVLSTPIETVKTVNLSFKISDLIDQKEINEENLVLGLDSCLGKTAVCGVIVEKYFPEAKIELAEVWEDFFADTLFKMFRKKPGLQKDPSFLREWVMYEEPHVVLVVSGVQYEPLSSPMGFDVAHPRVKEFPFWEGIAASRLSSVASCESDSEERLRLFDMAEEICPGMTLIGENRVQPLVDLGRQNEAIECLKWSLERRLNARRLYAICHLMENIGEDSTKYLAKFLEKYPFKISEYF